MAETIYTKVDYDLGSLMNFIELGEIALPDIQRPFVWSNAGSKKRHQPPSKNCGVRPQG